MRWPGQRRIVRGLAWLRSRAGARALVLGYHRVGEPGHDPHGLSVSRAAFERHLDTIQRHASPVFLSELVENLRRGEIDSGRIAVTFDDAYARTLRHVEPLLRERGVPATVFVPTRLLGTEPWWDRLARLLSADRPLPAELVVPLGEGTHFHRPLGPTERAPGARGRVRLTMEAYGALRSLTQDALGAALDAIEDWTGGSDVWEREVVVSESELEDLDRSHMFEIGSHSVTHPVLPELQLDAQRSEIEESRRALESLLGHPVELFSYPNGAHGPETDELVREAGYRGACASQPGVVTAGCDAFALPRFWPGDDEGDVSRVVRRWL